MTTTSRAPFQSSITVLSDAALLTVKVGAGASISQHLQFSDRYMCGYFWLMAGTWENLVKLFVERC